VTKGDLSQMVSDISRRISISPYIYHTASTSPMHVQWIAFLECFLTKEECRDNPRILLFTIGPNGRGSSLLLPPVHCTVLFFNRTCPRFCVSEILSSLVFVVANSC